MLIVPQKYGNQYLFVLGRGVKGGGGRLGVEKYYVLQLLERQGSIHLIVFEVINDS